MVIDGPRAGIAASGTGDHDRHGGNRDEMAAGHPRSVDESTHSAATRRSRSERRAIATVAARRVVVRPRGADDFEQVRRVVGAIGTEAEDDVVCGLLAFAAETVSCGPEQRMEPVDRADQLGEQVRRSSRRGARAPSRARARPTGARQASRGRPAEGGCGRAASAPGDRDGYPLARQQTVVLAAPTIARRCRRSPVAGCRSRACRRDQATQLAPPPGRGRAARRRCRAITERRDRARSSTRSTRYRWRER